MKAVFWPFENSLQAQKNTAKAIAVLALIAAVYAGFHRSWKDFLANIGPVAAVVTVIMLTLAIKVQRDNQRWLPPEKKGFSFTAVRGILLVLVIIVPPLSLAYYVLAVAIKDLFIWGQTFVSEAAFGPGRVRTIVAAITLVIGRILYAVRTNFRACYGVTEIVIGVLVSLVKTSESSIDSVPEQGAVHITSAFAIALLTAGVYLVVRGFESVAEGLKDGKDPAVAALFTWLKRRRYLH